MATNNSIIPPFPNHIDRDQFGAWTSGFVAGEGYFGLGMTNDHGCKGSKTPWAHFIIQLRRDDKRVLELIRSYFGIGIIRDYKPCKTILRANPGTVYRINRVPQLNSVIIPHFDRFPLFAKKQKDFEIWKAGVEFIVSVCKSGHRGKGCRADRKAWWKAPELAKFQEYAEALKQAKRYVPDSPTNGHPIPIIEPYRPTSSQGLLFD